MIDNSIDLIIARFIDHEASDEEVTQLLEWLKASDENKRYFIRRTEIWHAIYPAFTAEEINLDEAILRIERRTDARTRRTILGRLTKIWSGIAAVMLLPMAIAIFYLIANRPDAETTSPVTLTTAYGCTSHFEFPDGSEVWLNSNSRLSYVPTPTACRNVLLDGEAYFSVHSDTSNPFIVNTQDLKITSTGTKFNVNAYDSIQAVTLVEGKLAVATGRDKWTMSPAEHLTYANGAGARITSGTDVDKYCSWHKGMLIFNNEPLSVICSRLCHLFNVKIEIEPEVAVKKFHIILNGEDIHEFIYLLQLSGEVDCTVEKSPTGYDGQKKIAIRRK